MPEDERNGIGDEAAGGVIRGLRRGERGIPGGSEEGVAGAEGQVERIREAEDSGGAGAGAAVLELTEVALRDAGCQGELELGEPPAEPPFPQEGCEPGSRAKGHSGIVAPGFAVSMTSGIIACAHRAAEADASTPAEVLQ